MTTRTYDVLIIGSGASGATAARQLTRKGIHCLMLDAGPGIDYARHRELRKVYTLPYRGFGTPGRFPHVTQADEYNENVWADEKQNPYTYPKDDPYYWVRVRLLGGKTNFWGRASWRLSNYEFKGKDHDGFGENWPIEYQDLAPYYDQVEPMLRVAGRKEGLAQLPDGVFIEDNSPDSDTVQRFIAAAKKRNVPTTKSRVATGQRASSVNRILPAALETGKLQIVSNAVVREITTDRNTGLANGAHFLDTRSKQEFHAKARVVIVGASTLESCRLLLNSGLANSSGVLGHYLFDQFYVKNVVSCIVPESERRRGRLRSALPQSRKTRERFHPWLRHGFRRRRLAISRTPPAFWRRSPQENERSPGRRLQSHHHGRSSAALRKLRRNQQVSHRRMGHSRSPHHREIRRERVRHGQRLHEHRRRNLSRRRF